MKIHIVSDLHVEGRAYNPEPVDCDVVVLAGDIHYGCSVKDWVKETYPNKHIIHVAGNHEYYRGVIEDVDKELDEHDEYFNSLQGGVRIIDNVAFVGATLWTNMDVYNPTTLLEAQRCMTDYRLIQLCEGHRLLPTDTIAIHDQHLQTIKDCVRMVRSFTDKYKIVIVTHHAPSFKSVNERFKGNALNGAFVSDLEDDILFMNPHLWIHGHCHDAVDYVVGDTRVICNPRGYRSEDGVNGFNPGLVVEV